MHYSQHYTALMSLSTVYPWEASPSPKHSGPKTKLCHSELDLPLPGCRSDGHQGSVSLGLSVHQGALLQISREPAMLAFLSNSSKGSAMVDTDEVTLLSRCTA